MFSCAQRRDRKIGESEGERVGVSRRVVGAGVHLLMNPMNGVFVCERETSIIVGSRSVWTC